MVICMILDQISKIESGIAELREELKEIMEDIDYEMRWVQMERIKRI